MPSSCVKVVEWVGDKIVQVGVFCTIFVVAIKYLTSQVFFIHPLNTAYKQPKLLFTQPPKSFLYLLFNYLYSLSLIPTTNMKLI
jgi:hypothetical protein